MAELKRVGIAVDAWKVPIFEQHLKKAGYTYSVIHGGPFTTITISGVAVEPLAKIITLANAEAKKRGLING